MNFRFLSGDYNWERFGGRFVTRRIRHRNADYYLVLDFRVISHSCADRYAALLSVVSPTLFLWSRHALQSKSDAVIINNYQHALAMMSGDETVDFIYTRFGGAFVWEGEGGCRRALFRQARLQANDFALRIDELLSQAQGHHGLTGYDIIQGVLKS